MTEEQQIRDLIERWASAVHAGDLPAVLADHAPDIVMFDVPPPEQRRPRHRRLPCDLAGVLRMAGVRRVFEIESLEVTAGPDVAFAFALLRVRHARGSSSASQEQRLRLTIGLRKAERPLDGHARASLVCGRDRVGAGHRVVGARGTSASTTSTRCAG